MKGVAELIGITLFGALIAIAWAIGVILMFVFAVVMIILLATLKALPYLLALCAAAYIYINYVVQ